MEGTQMSQHASTKKTKNPIVWIEVQFTNPNFTAEIVTKFGGRIGLAQGSTPALAVANVSRSLRAPLPVLPPVAGRSRISRS